VSTSVHSAGTRDASLVRRGVAMNWTVIEGKWKQLKGDVRSRWAKLTDDDVGMLDGKRESLSGKIVERYGIMKDEAERQIDEWLAKMDTNKDEPSHAK
jgi:uncharacterized protein YjbJ (UPF0337 family)